MLWSHICNLRINYRPNAFIRVNSHLGTGAFVNCNLQKTAVLSKPTSIVTWNSKAMSALRMSTDGQKLRYDRGFWATGMPSSDVGPAAH